MAGSEDVRLSEAGIEAIEVYFPRDYVEEEALEQYDGVSSGKYTIGLGQEQMAFVGDREDVVSMSMTVVRRLAKKNGLDLQTIGRLEVGTETIIDKSKAVKTALMELFAEVDNFEVEGLDTTNACYGGTAAIFNALSWMESPWWDGRKAIVVCADVAVYERGPARPTGGAGAVAMLLSRDKPPIRFEIGGRATHMEHTYDFFKPRLGCEYPTVNGAETLSCYLRALDRCYKLLRKRLAPYSPIGDIADYMVLHAPFNKMVRKSFARIRYNDFLLRPDAPEFKDLQEFSKVSEADSYNDKALEKAFIKESTELYNKMTKPSEWLAKRIGNAYTASLWSSLAALLEDQGDELIGKRILMFSYGSGLASSMFSVRVINSVANIASKLSIRSNLDERTLRSPEFYSEVLARKEELYQVLGKKSTQSLDDLWPDATYLCEVDELGRRLY
eukprot:CAMPEP_0198722348 /NCGR_PEP_ID=MMETSP1475-20131203/112_1 /TAXON_ID= ORGANISM="Unidentified sp., Strain CCMP1999" /NCGR_SAMPLE_ID=MMETSP1475 /ASSEMBLY_ACC=CAM_ASM_001111 /LENGTH=443 /DNA_ID=CAMNT_0044483251 /DNA_START=103 /DNA_END=1431 /DNA_ORIENTATION=-